MGFFSTFIQSLKMPFAMATMNTDVTYDDDKFDNMVKEDYKDASSDEKKVAALLSLALDKIQKKGEDLERKHSNSVKLDYTDKNEFRNDETVSRVNATENISTPASELEDIPREKGGRVRGSRDK